MRDAVKRYGGAAALLLAVSACTGVPTGGAVHAGTPGGAPGAAAPNIHIAPQQPVAGELPIQMVDEFRLASSFFDDWSIARAYLVDPSWTGDQGAMVVNETGATSSATFAGDTASVHVDDTLMGTISPDGVYEPAVAGKKVSYTYQLTKDSSRAKGQWRIVNPPPYLVLTSTQVQDSYQRGYVYYLSPGGQFVVPVRVFLPVPQQEVAAALVNELLHGPPQALAGAVTTAIPSTTTQLTNVSQSDDVVTVNLSSDLASLSPTERDQAAAQITYTLRDFGSGEIRIESAGQPLTTSHGSGIESVKTWSAYDADALVESSFYFSDVQHRARNQNDLNIAGDLGDGVTPVIAAVAAPRPASLGGGELVAGVSPLSGGTFALYAGGLRAPKQVAFGSSFTTPSWDSQGDLWTVEQTGNSSAQQVLVAPVSAHGVHFLTVQVKDLPVDFIESLKVSRDGTRVAVIGRSTTTGSQLWVGSVVKRGNAESIEGFRPVASGLAPVTDGVVWASSTTLDVLASSQGGNAPAGSNQLWTVDVDGWSPPTAQSVPDDVVSIAAAPHEPLVVGVAANAPTIELYNGREWVTVGQGTAPNYPG